MAKYINQSQRVFVIGDKHIIPGGEAVALTAEEEGNSFIQSHIADNDLIKVTEPISVIEDPKTPKK